MALVDYSDSDDSAVENTLTKPVTKNTKGAFQKVVDRSNLGKIRVSLPAITTEPDEKQGEPLAKRMKSSGGFLSNFNSFLPPPKRIGHVSNGVHEVGNLPRRSGSPSGFLLKTGAEPGFIRDAGIPTESLESSSVMLHGGDEEGIHSRVSPPSPILETELQMPTEDVKLIGRSLIFKPLSVARNPAKKKKVQAETPTITPTISGSVPTPTTTAVEQPILKPKLSLFSMVVEADASVVSDVEGEYQPTVYEMDDGKFQDPRSPTIEMNMLDERFNSTLHSGNLVSVPPRTSLQSLDDIAADMNLSAAERRQLFGRRRGDKSDARLSATKIINFNTDEEYKHNEELRATGEQVAHNPIKAIAPGKHSLKQLIGAAQSQKEALEESFAKGKSNRAESSSRYGW